jgi:hypothetical protein
MTDLRALTRRFPRAGRLDAILLRPRRDAAAVGVDRADAVAGRGLDGDRTRRAPRPNPAASARSR